MAPKNCEKQDEGLNDAAQTSAPSGSRSDVGKEAKPKRWYERTSVTLCVAAAMILVAFGFVHVITGVVSPLGLPFDLAWKESFGYRETLVDAETIQALPYLAAKIRYPLGCKALQRRDYLPSGREFEAHAMGRQRESLRQWQAEFEGSLDTPQRPWQDRLQGERLVAPNGPEDANACNQRGIAFAREGQYEAAIAQFSRAIQRNPVFVEACHNRALVYVAIGNLGQGVSDFSRVIQIEPEGVKGYENRGRLHLEMSHYEQAISDFEKIVEIDPRHAEAHFLRALACYAKGQYEKAWEGVEKLQSLGLAVPAGFVIALHEASGLSTSRRTGSVRR
jgi:tetratricopeptide (TPR) repeat protein